MKISNKIIQLSSLLAISTLLLACKKNPTDSDNTKTGIQKPPPEASSIETHTPENCPTGKTCIICDASQRQAGRLWCKEHDRYEDRCWICHPDLQDKNRPYCKEHGVYENECLICHPEIKGQKKSTQTTPSPTSGKVLMCNEHGVPEHECAICHPELASSLKPGQALKINLPSEDSASMAGMGVSSPRSAQVTPSMDAYCVVNYNEDHVTRITPLVKGIIRELKVSHGKHVRKGDVLAVFHSPDLAKLKNSYLSAIALEKKTRLNYERKKLPSVRKVISLRQLETAEAEWRIAALNLSASRQLLINLDFSASSLERLKISRLPTATYSIRAPFEGTIVKREASIGQLADSGTALFTLVDLRSMWLELSIPATMVSQLALGMQVDATFDGIPNASFSAKIIWLDSEINPKTRLARARALVTHPTTALRKGLFGKARILTGKPQPSLRIPSAAIQRIDDVPFVFVKRSETLYSATRVILGEKIKDSNEIAITAGLNPEDQIVVKGSYLLRSEFLKSLLGAGCVDD